jgi:SAM-dependent methyltransferase
MFKQGFEVYGSDHSPLAINSCQQWINSDNLVAKLWCGELESIPYPDQTFDVVIAFNSIYHGTKERLERVMGLIYQKLRIGGDCFITLISKQNRMYGRGEYLSEDTYASPGMFNQLFPDQGEKGIPHYFCSRETVESLFRGFTIKSLKHQELEIPIVSRNQEHKEIVWLPIAKTFFWRVVATKNKVSGLTNP